MLLHMHALVKVYVARKVGFPRNESCGGHFREEYATKEGEAERDDKNYTFVSAWEYKGEPSEA